MIVADGDLNAGFVAETVIPLLRDPAQLEEMGRRAAGAGHRSAAAEVARIVLDVAALTRGTR
jgi:UDP-N-acetylglucosamine--N-acetylmuramyl-(pentapeptide) pyrophosphoryl-undecaprenol N-acetylglucosamine transferase